jgi:hypothetical protein
LAVVLDETVCGTPQEPGQYNVPMNYKDGTLVEIKFVDGWTKKLEKNLPEMLPRLFLKPEQANLVSWIECFKM